MGDAEHRTTLPLLNSYKYGLARRRLLQTVSGGLRLQKAPCYIHLLQLTIYLFPLALASPFIVLDAVGVWNEYYLAIAYTFIHALTIITLRLGVYCSMKGTGQECEDDDDDDSIDVTACCSHSTLAFIFSSKHIVSLCFHSLLVCSLLSFTTAFVLLPRVLVEHLPLAGAVVVGSVGWIVTCSTHYALNIHQPYETAIYRPTDLLGLGPLTRPAYFIACTTVIVTIRLTVSVGTADVYIQLLYAVVCVLPLLWTLGFLPPLDALLPWVMEQILTHLMGGSHMATDLRLLVMFLLSGFSTTLITITAQYGSSTASLLLAATTGYLLSNDLFFLSTDTLSITRISSTRVRCKSLFRHLLVSSLRAIVLLIVNLLVVYFSSTAKDRAKRIAGRVIGSCVIALTLFLWAGSACQGTYILRLIRNPLHPWRTDNVQRYKSRRKRLRYCNIPGALMLSYVSPILMLVFVTLEVDNDAPYQWFRAVGIACIFRKVWQNTPSAQSEVFIVSILLLVLPEDTVWEGLGVGLQTLLVGLCLTVFSDLFCKLHFILTLYLTFVINDRKKTHSWLYVLITVGLPLLSPLLLVITLLSSIVSAPLIPLFTLPVFLVSYPRTLRFWPSLFNYGSSYNSCRDSVYYEHDTPGLSRALLEVFSNGSVHAEPGDYFLLRYQDRILIAAILERGHRFLTLNIRGLEMQETSCHTIEATRIDDIFSSAYNPKSPKSPSFWLNCQLLHTMQPVDSVVIHTYSTARSVLTGIIDQPHALRRFSGNLLKCIVWVLHQYIIIDACRERGNVVEGGQERHRVKWRQRNKVVPVVDSESSSEPTQSVTHKQPVLQNTAEPSTTVVLGDDSPPWTSMESITEEPHTARDYECPPHTMSKLIPVDIPLHTNPVCISTTSTATVEAGTAPSSSLQSPFPSEWLEFPLLDSQLESLLQSFPSDWLSFICDGNTNEALTGDMLKVFRKLCLTCFSIVDVPHCSLGADQTRPFHIHSSFCGEFPYSTDREWLMKNQALHRLVLRAYRYAVKLLCDETALGEADDFSELSDYLQSYHSDYYIGSEGEEEWNHAILDNRPHLFSIGKSQDTDTYTMHMLTLQDQVVHIGKLNSAAVRAVWSDLALELLYLTNDDEERYGIQAHPSVLRNLIIQAADPPMGYAVYSSGIIRCPCIT